MTISHQASRRFRGPLSRFARDGGGVMAVELALLAPFVIFVLFGMIELTDAISAKRRVGFAASIVGDLTTNQADDWVTTKETEDLLALAGEVLLPYGITGTTVRITAVTYDDTKDEVVTVWSRQRNPDGTTSEATDAGYVAGDAFPDLDTSTHLLPGETIITSGMNMIVAEVNYPFTSTLSNMFFPAFDIRMRELRVPRVTARMRYCEPDEGTCSDGTVWDTTNCMPLDAVTGTTVSRC